MKKICLLLLFVLFSVISLSAQITHEQSIDIPVREDRRKECMPIGNDGLLLLDAAPGVSKRNWELSHYDKNLTLKRKVAIRLPGDYQYNMAFANTDQAHFHFLFNHGEKIHLATYNKTTGSITELSAKLTDDGTITRLESLNEHIYIVMATRKSTTFNYFNSKTGTVNQIALPNAGKKIEITDIVVNKDENVYALALLNTEINKELKSRVLEVHFFESNSKTIGKPIQVKSEVDHNIIQANIKYINRNKIILTGSYTDSKDENARGVFFASFDNNVQEYMHYFPFKDITKFFSIYDSKKNGGPISGMRISNVRPRTAKVVLHNLLEIQDAYLFTFEAYIPQFEKSYNGSHSKTIFVGNFYTHATVLKINKNGEQEGQSIFTLDFNDLNRLPAKHVNVLQNKNTTSFVFRRKHEMYLATLEMGTSLKEKKVGLVEEEQKKKLFSSRKNVVTRHWYDDLFIIYEEKDMEEKRANPRKHIYQIDIKKIALTN